MSVETTIEDARWSEAGLPALAKAATDATLQHLALDPDRWEISLLGCDDTRIKTLNETFRDKGSATNVLSWPSADRAPAIPGAKPAPPEASDPELGDIAIAFETCMAEAAQAELKPADHVTHLIVHGTLHLLGYDHIDDMDAALMEGLEAEILASLGVADPY